MSMASKNIAIKDEAYNFLKSVKPRGGSFSDAILGFKKRNAGIMRFFGTLSEKNWEGNEKRMARLRKSFEERLDDRA